MTAKPTCSKERKLHLFKVLKTPRKATFKHQDKRKLTKSVPSLHRLNSAPSGNRVSVAIVAQVVAISSGNETWRDFDFVALY